MTPKSLHETNCDTTAMANTEIASFGVSAGCPAHRTSFLHCFCSGGKTNNSHSDVLSWGSSSTRSTYLRSCLSAPIILSLHDPLWVELRTGANHYDWPRPSRIWYLLDRFQPLVICYMPHYISGYILPQSGVVPGRPRRISASQCLGLVLP